MKIGEKEKRKNKGTNKKQQPDLSILDASAHCPCVPSFNLIGLTVPEKSVMKIFDVLKLDKEK